MAQTSSRTAISVAAIGFLVSALFLGLNAELARRNLHRLSDAQRSVLHTHQVLADLDAVLLGLKEAEIAQLGFLVTGDESYLGRYVTAEVRIGENLERVNGLVADNPAQSELMLDTRKAVDAKLQEFRRSIDAWKRQDLAAARKAVLVDRDHQGAREALAQMQNAERDLLEVRAATSKRDYRSALTSSVLAAIFGLVLLAVAYSLVRRNLLIREQAHAAKDEFLAMLGHELRNPLAAVRNALTAAGLDPSARERALEIARRQTGRLTRLVDDLLDVARITRRKISLRKERVSLGEVARRAFDATRAAAADRGHELSIADSPEPIEVEADPVRLEQVIDNLLTNAIKYTPPGGHIVLEICRENGEAVVRVRDDGVGIDARLLPKIFESFVQSERSPERADGGLGIGLTIVKLLVELHGGRVEARSAGPGTGAEFIIRLPAMVAAEAHPATPNPAAAPRRHPVRVLIVEDNADAAEALGLLLEVSGVEARIVHDGREALEVAKSERFELILVDIGLPGMDGYEVARRLREMPECRAARLAALTGYGRSEDRQKALAAGFSVHLVKPVELELLEPLLADLEASAEERPAV